MVEVLSQSYGRPGNPGRVDVTYLTGLFKGCQLDITVAAPGKGGKGGEAVDSSLEDEKTEFVDRGGAGGGRENIPIIEAFIAYVERFEGTERQPLFFPDPGHHIISWPFETPTATVVMIASGGGGGGGMGDTLPGEDGEDGLPGVVFLFPTYIPVQRPRETEG